MKRMQTIGIAVLIIFAFVSLAQGIRNAMAYSQDFQWDAAKLLWERQNPYEISLEGKIAETDAYMPDQLAANQLPSVLILLWPYVLFPWPIAKALWLLSNLVFTLLFLIFSIRLFLPLQQPLIYVLIACLFVASTPWRNLIGLGQHTVFSLCFFVLAIWYCERGKPNLAGFMLTVSLFKYTTILPLLLYFVYLRQYRSLVIAVITHGAATLFISAWIGEWPHVLVLQSLTASAKLSNAGYLDLFSLFKPANQGNVLIPTFFACSLLLLSTWGAIYRKPNSSLIALSTFSFVSTVVVYHRPYDYVVLLFPLLLLSSQNPIPYFKINFTSLLSGLFASCLILTWYADKIIYTVSARLHVMQLGWIEQYYHFSLGFLWYLTILCAIFYLVTPIDRLGIGQSSSLNVQV